jgi:hypothetical protein
MAGVGHRWRGRAAVVGLAALLAACSSSTPATPAGPGSSGNAPGASLNLTAPPKVGPADPALVQYIQQSIPADATAEGQAGQALAAADRAEVNAGVVVGTSIPELQAALDATFATGAQQLQAKLASKVPSPSAAPSPSALGCPGTQGVVTAVLAAFRKPTAGSRPLDAGAMLADLLTYVILFGGSGIDVYDPKKDSFTDTEEINQPVAGQTGVSGQISISVAIENTSRVVNVAIQVEEQAQKVDANGAVVGSVAGTSSFAVSINPCPDAGGKVAGHLDIMDSETDYSSTVAKTANIGERYTGSTDFAGQIDDSANLASVQFSGTAERATKGGTSNAGDANFTPVETDVAMSFSDTIPTNGGAYAPGDFAVTTVTGDATAEDGKATAGAVGILFGMGTALAVTTGDIYKHGKCFEIRVTPDGGDVGPSSKTEMKVKIYHWVDKAEVQLPVKATLDGTQAVDPSGTDQTTPTTVTFTAGTVGTTGTVTLKSTSKRGIGEHTSTFNVSAKLHVVITGTLVEVSGGLATYHLKIAASDVILTANPDGSLAFSGTATVKGSLTFSGVPCSGTINEQVGVVGMGSLQGPDDAKVFHVQQFGPGSLTNLGSTITCPVIGPVKTNNGDFFGQWSLALGPVDLPAMGGTVSAHGSTSGLLSRTSTGTFVATPS